MAYLCIAFRISGWQQHYPLSASAACKCLLHLWVAEAQAPCQMAQQQSRHTCRKGEPKELCLKALSRAMTQL